MRGAAGLRVLRLANPLVRLVLASRAHRLLSERLLVLSYRGRRSGREHRIPLRYAETSGGALVAVAVRPERKQWWRTFLGGEDAVLLLRGARLAARGVVTDGPVRDDALRAYLERYPRSRRLTEDAAVVVLEPGTG
ncbi:MAG TPA: hypothetical protein VFG75_12935 [Gaiella sp.]|nr:hypothetical protein [Gaiella sp.]